MNRVFFTSDTHFGHKLMVEKRGFNSQDEHDRTLVENWNAVVRPGDRVYHLGDFALGVLNNAITIAGALHGNIYLIRGNHDKLLRHERLASRFVWVRDVEQLKIEGQKVWLSHYAHRVWPASHYGSWHLYGHSHGNLTPEPYSLSFDVSVEGWDFTPISWDNVKATMEKTLERPGGNEAK